jgi:hypothetical protein
MILLPDCTPDPCWLAPDTVTVDYQAGHQPGAANGYTGAYVVPCHATSTAPPAQQLPVTGISSDLLAAAFVTGVAGAVLAAVARRKTNGVQP